MRCKTGLNYIVYHKLSGLRQFFYDLSFFETALSMTLNVELDDSFVVIQNLNINHLMMNKVIGWFRHVLATVCIFKSEIGALF